MTTPDGDQDPLSSHVYDNIDSIVTFHQREDSKLTAPERILRRVCELIGQPAYLFSLLGAIGFWMLANVLSAHLSLVPLDPPPFAGLQGFMTFAALATSTVVLITQQRQARLENQRAHLDLQVNLLTEQKVTKLIHLIEELRRDMPNVRDRDDPEATALQERTDTTQVLSALAGLGIGPART
jgi:uncharacterized membrane protein